MTTLDGIRLRLDRADERLALLDRQRAILLKRKRNRVVGQFDPRTDDYVFRVPGQPPPQRLGLAVGEFAYYLRAVLDNLLWQLVKARFGNPTRNTQFPIYEDETKSLRKTKGGVPVIEAQTAGISGPDFTFIEGLQPYKAGPNLAKWHPLAMLGFLNDVDKHRYIHAAFAAGAQVPMGGPHAGRFFLQSGFADAVARMGLMGVPLDPAIWERTGDQAHTLRFQIAGTMGPTLPSDGPITIATYSFDGSPDDPAEVCRVFGIRSAWPDAKMEMEPGFLLDVSFSERERPLNVYDLREIRATVQQVVDRFAPEIR